MKDVLNLIGALMVTVAVVGITIGTLAIRLSNPQFTETQLFLYMLPYTGISALVIFVGYMLLDVGKSKWN